MAKILPVSAAIVKRVSLALLCLGVAFSLASALLRVRHRQSTVAAISGRSDSSSLLRAAAVKGPTLVTVSPSRYDFGTVPSGLIVTHEFLIQNVSEAPVTVRILRSSCGCTTATLDKSVIEPGELGTLRAALNTASAQTAVGAEITLSAMGESEHGGGGSESFAVSLAADIDAMHGVNPAAVRFDSLRRGGGPTSAAFELRLSMPGNEAPDVRLDGAPPYVVAEIETPPRRAGRDWIFSGRLTVTPDQLPADEAQFSSEINIGVSQAKGLSFIFALDASGAVAEEIEVRPKVLYWGPEDRRTKRELVLNALDDDLIDVRSVECAERLVTWSLVGDGGSRPTLVVECPAAADAAGVRRGILILRAARRKGRSIRIAIPIIIM